MKNPAKNKTEQKRLRSSSVSNQSRFFSSTLTSTLTSSTANRNVKKVYTFESLDIIERPEKYIKKYAETSSAIKYLLMLHSDRIEVIEFLLFNEAAKQFEPTDLSKFDNSCKRIFPQLASSIVREMASSANTSEVEHAKRIASKFCELKYRVHLRHLKIDHNNKTLSDFYKSIADGNTPAHPFCDSKAQLELKYDFLFQQ